MAPERSLVHSTNTSILPTHSPTSPWASEQRGALGTVWEGYGGGLPDEGLRERFVVFVPRLGIEGFTRVRDLAPIEQKSRFHAVTYAITVEGSTGSGSMGLFYKVVVKVMDNLEKRTPKWEIKVVLLIVTSRKLESMKGF
ncbi:hypothetical protein HOY82DRAFT_595657 [Tuber indicum]|nr:hypothetical protein HOY82DRAFT_595657 [Tuber indicum]